MTARILIIEDHEPSLDLVRYLLEASGYRTMSERDGIAAIERAHREPPDLVVCDMKLRDIDGYQLIRQFREDPLLHDVPLLAVTAFSTLGDRNTVVAAGFVELYFKPIEPETFVAEVERFLPTALRAAATDRRVY